MQTTNAPITAGQHEPHVPRHGNLAPASGPSGLEPPDRPSRVRLEAEPRPGVGGARLINCPQQAPARPQSKHPSSCLRSVPRSRYSDDEPGGGHPGKVPHPRTWANPKPWMAAARRDVTAYPGLAGSCAKPMKRAGSAWGLSVLIRKLASNGKCCRWARDGPGRAGGRGPGCLPC